MIPKIIHHVWPDTKPIPQKFITFMNTFKDKHPDFKFYLWDLNNLPSDTSQHVLDILKNDNYGYAIKADILRLEILRLYGGVYVDTDMECLKPLYDFLDYDFFIGKQDRELVNTAIIGCTKDNDIIAKCMNIALSNLSNTSYDILNYMAHVKTGPHVFTEVIKNTQTDNKIKCFEPEYFYPIHFTELHRLNEETPNAYTKHWWNGGADDGWVVVSQRQRRSNINDLYKRILNREADTGGLENYFNSDLSLNQIKDILLTSDEYKQIKHIFREDMLSALPSGVCAEIGVLKGEYSSHILYRNRPSKLYLIDVWSNIELNYYDSNMTDNNTQNSIYQEVQHKFGNLDNVNIIRSLSTDAVQQFEDNTFDWIYVDADHSFEGCYNDLVAYDKKVKIDGYICGHDWLPEYFSHEGFDVNNAVLKFVKEKNYILSLITDEYEYKSFVISKTKTAHDILIKRLN